jgi:hypothetical protein
MHYRHRQWLTDIHWNEVTLFGRLIERAAKAEKGDLVHIVGRVRQNSYDRVTLSPVSPPAHAMLIDASAVHFSMGRMVIERCHR